MHVLSNCSFCVSHSSRSKAKSCPIRLPMGPDGASPQTHTHIAERHSFVFLKFSGTTTQNLTGKTTFLRRVSLAKLPVKFAAELVGKMFGKQLLEKPSLIFLEKPPKKFHLHISPFSKRAINTSQEPCLLLKSAQGNNSGQGTLCVHALQIERQARGTKRVPKLGFPVLFAVT